MIKAVLGSKNIIVNGYAPNPYISPGAQSAGMVRYNTNMQQMEVYDGMSWHVISGTAEVSLTPAADSAIAWAMKKMAEEAKIDELCKKYPGLGKARDNFETFLRLVESEESVPTS